MLEPSNVENELKKRKKTKFQKFISTQTQRTGKFLGKEDIYIYIYFEVSAQSLYVHRKCYSSFV